VFIPNYFTSNDLSDPAVQNRIEINFFINDLYLSNSGTKNIIDSTEWLLGYTNYWIDSNGGLTSSNKIALTYALTKLSMVVDQFSPTNYNMESLAAFKLTAYQFLLEHGQRLTQLDTQTQQNILRICTNFENIEFADETIQYQIDNNWSSEGAVIANSLRNAKFENPNMNFDVEASSKSPFNIDFSLINNATTEGAKFNEVYDALKESPEFKKLFIDIFEDSKRDNVKFEIDDHVFEDNDPTKKEVNATTSLDPVSKNIIIKISKQILLSGTTMSQTKIENAKTILHECIHAYLFVKANYPATGVDFVKILNSMYPNAKEQHDFMYDHMIPIMQKVLTEIRDAVTTAPKRANLEIYRFYASSTASQPFLFNWQEYYKHISYSGLDLTSCFKQEFPDPSQALTLHLNYIKAGEDELDR
jgi:hypothetical protein